MADEVDVSVVIVVLSVVVVPEVVVDDDESSEELLAQESIRPKANAKIVGKKRNFSFFIEPKYALDT